MYALDKIGSKVFGGARPTQTVSRPAAKSPLKMWIPSLNRRSAGMHPGGFGAFAPADAGRRPDTMGG